MPVGVFRPASLWKKTAAHPSRAFLAELGRLRNEPEAKARDAVRWYGGLIESAVRRFGCDEDVSLAVFRAPGRVNLLGTHIDHRGGRVNPIAVRELVLVCIPRPDDRVRLANANPDYTDAEFLIPDLLPDGHVSDWADWTLSTPKLLKGLNLLGHWSSYVRSALAYFTNAWGGERSAFVNGPEGSAGVNGFDLFVDSQLPQAAGLSSSSSLVVASAQALHHVNGHSIDPLGLAEGCGQAEWYVGTRGGSGDQAAIALGRSGHVSHVDFFPMQVDWSPWPEGYSVVVCHSRIHAQKTANARSTFNERVATYVIALAWIKHLHPEWGPKLVHLRDVLRLGLSHADIYRLLKELPHRVWRWEIRNALPDARRDLDKLFTTHDEPCEGYRVRDVCLYGLAECERSRQLADYLRGGDISGVGTLINLSHEGDRVTRLDDGGNRIPADRGLDNDDLDRLIRALESDEEEVTSSADLARQPGGYACSSPDLDELVDLARSVDGVVGAGLIGAGIGGCVEVIVADEAVDRLRTTLLDGYYGKHNREPFIEAMVPVEGAGPLTIGQA